MASKKKEKWPGREETALCPDCHGSGAAPGALARAAESRVTELAGSFGSEVRPCSRCQGRGRVLAATVTTPTCGHGFHPDDCAICHRNKVDYGV